MKKSKHIFIVYFLRFIIIIILQAWGFDYLYKLSTINYSINFLSNEIIYICIIISILTIILTISQIKNEKRFRKLNIIFNIWILVLLLVNSLRFFNFPFNYGYCQSNDNGITVYTSLFCGREMIIPSYIDGKEVVSVSSVSNHGFEAYSGAIDKVIVPESVKNITADSKCFSKAKSIVFKGKMEAISGFVFSSETEHIIFEKDIGIIQPYAFASNNSKLKTVEFYGDIEYISDMAFDGCENVEVIYK